MGNKTEEEIMDEENIEDGTERKITLLDYLLVLAKRKKLIIIFTLSIAILTAIYSLIVPEMYRSSVTILKPAGTSLKSGLMGQLGNIMGLGGSSSSTLNNPKVIGMIIESRVVSDGIIDKFNLMELYDTSSREDARDILSGALNITNRKTASTISISVSAKDPQLAADMANTYVKLVKVRIQELSLVQATRKRVFFEEQLKKTNLTLLDAEEAMREFQEKTGIVAVGKEMNITIDKFAPALMLEYQRIFRQIKFNETLFEIIAKQYEMARIDEANPTSIMVIQEAFPPEYRYSPKRRRMVQLATLIAFFISAFLALLMEYIAGQQAHASDETMEKINRLKKHLSFKWKVES